MEVSIPRSSHFSLGTSPYYAHQNGLALDIYHKIGLDNYHALSPVAGRIIETKKLMAPKPKFSAASDKEYLILIENEHNSEIVYKFLHIKPAVNEGQRVKIGDILGTTIRNGYFAPWSSPHLHLEIRPTEDRVRARGGKDFSLLFDPLDQVLKFDKKSDMDIIPITIQAIFSEFLLVHFPEDCYYSINPYFGVRGRISDSDCIIDGGIPLYKKGILLTNSRFQTQNQALYLFNEKKLGTIGAQRGSMGFIDFEPIQFYLDKVSIRGISLFIAKFKPFIKIIPYNMKDLNVEINSIYSLTLQ